MTEHRVPMLGALRRHPDPERSRDPKVRELVAALATLEVAPAPRPDFRAELRAQLVAVTPRLVTEGEPATATPAQGAPVRRTSKQRASKQRAEGERRRGFGLAKPLIAAACVLAAFVLLLGGAVLISQHALPGDALYGIKRASEDTEYSLTGGAVAKGKLKLEFAATRISEVGQLLPRAGAMSGGVGAVADSGTINAGTAGLVRDTLASANGDVQTAAQLLGSSAVRNHDPGPLNAISSWAPAQLTAMRTIVARIPAGSLHRNAVTTLAVLATAQHRAAALRGELGCSCLDSVTSDNFGPVPCTAPCAAKAPGGTPQPGSTPSGPRPAPTGSGTIGRPGQPGASTAPNSGGGPSATGTPTVPPPTGSGSGGHPSKTTPVVLPSLPGLPSPTIPGGTGSGSLPGSPSVPISVNSCGLSLPVGPLGVGVGGC